MNHLALALLLALCIPPATCNSDTCSTITVPSEQPREPYTIRTNYLFATPLIKTNLHAFVPDLRAFNARLAAHVLQDYADFLADTTPEPDAQVRNHNFFDYQTGNDASDEEQERIDRRAANMHYRTSVEFATLEAAVTKVAKHVAEDILDVNAVMRGEERDEDGDEDLVLQFQSWAAVHFEGGSHGLHFHEDSSLSAVYYVRMPERSGKITFYDPRGPRPPFGAEIVVRPKEGDLIVFPAWLAHAVGETGRTDGARISIPFNCEGNWQQSSSVRTESSVEVADLGGGAEEDDDDWD